MLLGYTISFSSGHFEWFWPAGSPTSGDESGQDRLCSVAGIASSPRFRVGNRTLSPKRPAAVALVRGPTLLHDLRAADRSLQFARDCHLSACTGDASLSLAHSTFP